MQEGKAHRSRSSRRVYVQGKSPEHKVNIKIRINSTYQLPELVHGSSDGQVMWDVPLYLLVNWQHNVQNLTWESAHEPPFTLPDVPVQVGAAHASPGALHSGEIADWQ